MLFFLTLGQVCYVLNCCYLQIQKRGPVLDKRVLEEIKIHRRLNHPNILKFFTSFEDNEHFYLVLELGTGGTLLAEHDRFNKHFSESISKFGSLHSYKP